VDCRLELEPGRRISGEPNNSSFSLENSVSPAGEGDAKITTDYNKGRVILKNKKGKVNSQIVDQQILDGLTLLGKEENKGSGSRRINRNSKKLGASKGKLLKCGKIQGVRRVSCGKEGSKKKGMNSQLGRR